MSDASTQTSGVNVIAPAATVAAATGPRNEGSERALPRLDLPAPDSGDPGTEPTCRGRRP